MTEPEKPNEPSMGPEKKSRPHLSIRVRPEPHPVRGHSVDKAREEADYGQLLNIFPVHRFQTTIEDLKKKVETDLHNLRKSHITKLFWLTVCWIFVVWVILLLQGFTQWFLPYPGLSEGQHYLHFKLTNTVLVSFITSTTATVLGLYGIAAYWLYGGRKKEGDNKEESKKTAKDSDNEEGEKRRKKDRESDAED